MLEGRCEEKGFGEGFGCLKGFSKVKGLPWPKEAVSTEIQLKVKRESWVEGGCKQEFQVLWDLVPGLQRVGDGKRTHKKKGRERSLSHPRRPRKAGWKSKSLTKLFWFCF